MEHEPVKKEANTAAFQKYDKALRAYQVARRMSPIYWKAFNGELSKFVMGQSPHELVFETAHPQSVRCMPNDLIKTAIALAKENGVDAIRLTLPAKLMMLPEWIQNFTKLEQIEIGPDFGDVNIYLQQLPQLKKLVIGQTPTALSEIEVPATCDVVCDGYEKFSGSPLEKFGRLLKVHRYSDGVAKETILYRATHLATEASFNIVDQDLDPEENLNALGSTGICGTITQLWLEERRTYRQAKATYLAWREWAWWSEIQKEYASKDGKKFQFMYQKFADLIRQKSKSQKTRDMWANIVNSRIAVFGDTPTYVFRLSKMGEFLAIIFEKMIAENKKFHHMMLCSIEHEMGLEFNIKEDHTQNKKTFKLVFFDPNKSTRHSINRATSLTEVRGWTATRLTGSVLIPLKRYAPKLVSQHFQGENDFAFYARDLERTLTRTFYNWTGDPDIHFIQKEDAFALEVLIFTVNGAWSSFMKYAWQAQALRSLNALNNESFEKKMDLIEGRRVMNDNVVTTLRSRSELLPNYIEVLQHLGLRRSDIAAAVADSLLCYSVRPHPPMYALMIQPSEQRIRNMKIKGFLCVVVEAVKLLGMSQKEIIKLFCPEYVSSLAHPGSTHPQPLSALCAALATDAIDEFFDGMQALGESNLLDDAGMDEILAFHLPSKDMWNAVRENAVGSNPKCGVAWLPLLVSELKWSRNSRAKILNLIGFKYKPSTQANGPLIGPDDLIDHWADWLIDLAGPLSRKSSEILVVLINSLGELGDQTLMDAAFTKPMMHRHPIVLSAIVRVARKLAVRTSTPPDTFPVDLIANILTKFRSNFNGERSSMYYFSPQILDDLCALTVQRVIDEKTLIKIWNSSGFKFDDETYFSTQSEKIAKLNISVRVNAADKLVLKAQSH